MATSLAPLAIEDILDPAWLTGALAPSGLVAEGIDHIEVEEIIKTSATKVRFVVETGGRRVALCAKGFFAGDLRPTAAAISQSEVRFYTDIAPSSNLRLPRCVYAAIDPATGHGLIILEDMVAKGAQFLSVLHPYSPGQLRGSLEQLAKLHASHWGAGALEKFPFLQSRVEWLLNNPLISEADLQALLDGERGAPLPASIRSASRLIEGVTLLAEQVKRQPPCVVHGDAHPGNVFEIDGEQGLVDWQLMQRGSWSLDVSYHICASLSVEDRRETERSLLKAYLARLEEQGVEAPSFACAWDYYRCQIVYGYYLWALTRTVMPDITCEMVRRLGLAVSDHGSFEALGC